MINTMAAFRTLRISPSIKNCVNIAKSEGWKYRRSHVINPAAGAGENYQVRIKTYYDYESIWNRYINNPILSVGDGGTWDDLSINFPFVIKVGFTYYLYYMGNYEIGLAIGTDGINFTKTADGIDGSSKVLAKGGNDAWDEHHVTSPAVVYHDSIWYMFYTGRSEDGLTYECIGVATSMDGKIWTKYESNPILSYGGTGWRQRHLCHADITWDSANNRWIMLVSGMDSSGHETIGRYYCTEANFPYTWTEDINNPVINYNTQNGIDEYHVYHPKIYPSKINDTWYIFYTAANGADKDRTICYATTLSLYNGNFTKCPGNPVISPSSESWEDDEVITPQCGIKIANEYYFYYCGIPKIGTRAIGLVRSEDIGTYFDEKQDNEVFLNRKCKTDFNDVRFTEVSGETELDYYMEEKIDGYYAVFWVKIIADISILGTTVYVYYGKSDAVSLSSIKNTSKYNQGDDFNDNERDVELWDLHRVGSGTLSEVNKRLEIQCPVQGDEAGYVSSNYKDLNQVAIRMFAHNSNLYNVQLLVSLSRAVSTLIVSEPNWYRVMLIEWYGYFYVERKINGSQTVLYSKSWLSDENIIEIKIDDGNISFYEGDILRATEAYALSSRNCYIYIAARGHGTSVGTDWADNFWIRKYVDPEPSHGAWGEEKILGTRRRGIVV